MGYLNKYEKQIKKAQEVLATSNTLQKNKALKLVAKALEKNKAKIVAANKIDMENAEKSGMSKGLLDRLYLDEKRIDGMIESIQTIISLPDPIGKSDYTDTLPNGLRLTRITVPIGIIAIIYESRPNVTVDAFALALKSGNAVILRGSSNSLNSNIAIEKAIIDGLEKSDIPTDVIHLVKDTDRDIVNEIITSNYLVDLAIPRGGHSLIQRVIKEATVPTLQTGEGNNHVYVDETADLDMALKIIKNAKLQRVGVCNAIEKILVHKSVADELLKKLQNDTKDQLEIRTDEKANKILPDTKQIQEEEWGFEYLDYILGVKIVENIDDAIDHINTYGTKHSEAIVTKDINNALLFQNKVDAAAVYVNASTRFTDGGEFGFGGEMGISTQKIHARGPIGLNELVSKKYIIIGNGQIR